MSEAMTETTQDAGARVEARGPCGMIALRGDFDAAGFREAVAGASGLALPARRRIEIDGARALAWMSPDELMLICDHAEAAALRDALSAALAGTHHLAAVVSDARALFRVSGASAREVLAKGAPADLSRGAFGMGDFRRTRLGQAAVAFWIADAGPPEAFDLVCFRSVAGHVRAWLDMAARDGAAPGFL